MMVHPEMQMVTPQVWKTDIYGAATMVVIPMVVVVVMPVYFRYPEGHLTPPVLKLHLSLRPLPLKVVAAAVQDKPFCGQHTK
jgi:hypothetical protein